MIEGICKVLNISANHLLGIEENKVVENGNAIAEQEIRNNMIAEPLLIEFGEALVPCVVAGLETDYVNQERKELAKRTGILMPILHIKDNTDLEKQTYRIISYDKILFESNLKVVDETTYRVMIHKAAEVCEAILRQGGSIRDMLRILEELEEL